MCTSIKLFKRSFPRGGIPGGVIEEIINTITRMSSILAHQPPCSGIRGPNILFYVHFGTNGQVSVNKKIKKSLKNRLIVESIGLMLQAPNTFGGANFMLSVKLQIK